MACKNTRKTRMVSEAVSESGLRSEPREVCAPVLGVAGCTWTIPRPPEGLKGQVQWGWAIGAVRVQNSRAERLGRSSTQLWGLRGLPRGCVARRLCRCWSPRPRAPGVGCVTRQGLPPPPPPPVRPEPGTASHGHRLGSQQRLLND